MKKNITLGVLLLIIIITGIAYYKKVDEKNQIQEAEAVKTVVIQFGEKLKMVSLLAPKEIINQDIEKNYSEYVSPKLIKKWQSDPINAPGRLTSSPWPDRIEISSTVKQKDSYTVEGNIIEVTSTGIANKKPITIELQKQSEKWMIIDIIKEQYQFLNNL